MIVELNSLYITIVKQSMLCQLYKYNSCTSQKLMTDFKKFIKQKIEYYSLHFKRKAILLEYNGEAQYEINLSFQHLSDQFMNKIQQGENNVQMENTIKISLTQLNQGLIKITDGDLEPLWKYIDASYKLSFNIENQSITDVTVLTLSELYKTGKCGFVQLKFKGNEKISQVGGVNLAAALKDNQQIEKIGFHGIKLGVHGANRVSELITCSKLRDVDLGLVGDASLQYLARILESAHHLQNLSFGQDENDPWEKGKDAFQQVIRRGEYNKEVFSVNLYPENLIKHWDMISELNILCKKRRNLKVIQRQNQFKATSLNPEHAKYYDPDNHSINAYKFSVKSYLTNVFGSDLDEALYFLQKQRRNSLREQAIFQITHQPINKIIMQDICTADGSIIVLAKYLLQKIKNKKLDKEQI